MSPTHVFDDSLYYENAVNLNIIQLAVEAECADRTFHFYRATLFVVLASAIFVGCITWDMAAIEPLDWSKVR